MKTKALLFVGFFALNLSSWEVHAINAVSVPTTIYKYDVEDPPPGYEKINLLGDLMLNIGPNAIVAGASVDAVYIGFNQSIGNVNISIFNGMGGLVYSTVVNTNVQQSVIIPFSSALSGSYTVEISNVNGYADGDFEHN